MPGLVNQWPAWPEFGLKLPGQSSRVDQDYEQARKAIIAEYGPDRLKQSWISVCERLREITEEIVAHGSNIIPVVSSSDVLQRGLNAEQEARVRRTGCLVIRGVIPKEETDNLYTELQTFRTENKDHIRGWPAESPSMLVLYNTAVQNAIRSDRSHLKVQKYLNSLWHDETNKSSPEPLMFLDGLRDRPPHQQFLGLGPHIDAGSLCRWADLTYRTAYSDVFAGNFDKYDPWDLSIRQHAKQDMFPASAHARVFRSFQGWTALTRAAPREGSLLLYPELSATVAYVLLRPFFQPPSSPEDLLDATKWTFSEDGPFPGTEKEQSQRLSRSSHPHLRLQECLVHIPRMEPGDTVWWHSDLCHAVDPEHQGTNNASVAFIAACPTTEINKQVVKEQLHAVLAGVPPPSYKGSSSVTDTKIKNYVGYENFGEEARMAFGYDL